VARSRWIAGVALAIGGSILFAAKGIVVKLAYRYGTSPETLIALRMAYSLPFFVLAAIWVERRTPAGDSPWRRGDAWRVVGMGLLGYYLSSYLDFLGLQYVSAGLERVILYLNPTLVMLITAVALRRRIAPRQWIALAIAYAGVAIVFSHDLHLGGPNVATGSALVFGSAVTYAIYLVLGGELVRRLGSIRLTAWAMIVSCVACIVQALVVAPGGMAAAPAAVHGLSVVNAVLCTVLPVFMVMMAVERVGPPVVSQLGMIGPAATIAMGAVFLGEPVGAAQLAGTAVVLAGIFVLTVRRA
jgi:drug/metabolite transporter (DMT)-like permease